MRRAQPLRPWSTWARRAAVHAILEAVDRTDSLVGSMLGGYRLLDQLGRCEMAAVYRALPETSLDPEQAVAVKVLRPQPGMRDMVARFRREIQVTRSPFPGTC